MEFGNLENVYTEKENNTFWDGVIHSFTYTNYPISRPELKHRDLAECAKYDALQEALINNFNTSQTKEEYLETIKAMGELRSDMALPVLEENLTIYPQGTNSLVFPVADAIIKIRQMTGYCLKRLEETKPLSVEESIWLYITGECYPEVLEYEINKRAESGDNRANWWKNWAR